MKEFMKWFNQSDRDQKDGKPGLPFSNSMFDMANINKYVQQSIEDALKPTQHMFNSPHSTSDPKEHTGFDYEVVELMLYYIVQIRLPKETDMDALRLTLGNCKLFVEGIGESKKTIPLPGQPSRRNISAQYSDGTIEVRLHKKREDYEKEIHVFY
ncbi:MAG: hypothetical protein WAM07_11485 [Halobacillus sp.]|uniref:hypothetical protein n=1 Tax=Halobacillus sp. TaxID=56800 RepID=UPI003BAF2A6F